jgi:hypothetical protein
LIVHSPANAHEDVVLVVAIEPLPPGDAVDVEVEMRATRCPVPLPVAAMPANAAGTASVSEAISVAASDKRLILSSSVVHFLPPDAIAVTAALRGICHLTTSPIDPSM